MQIFDIKRFLDHGDYVKIARLAGYTDLKKGRLYVYETLSGKRKGKRGTGKKILEAAETIAKSNESIMSSPASNLQISVDDL